MSLKNLINKTLKFLRFSFEALHNYFEHYEVLYIIEDANWVIQHEGLTIARYLNQKGIKTKTSLTHWGARDKIVHLGSINMLISGANYKKIHSSNKVILTWYHSAEDDPRLKRASEFASKVDLIHTSCTITKKQLQSAGVAEEKIFLSPIPVDLKVFKKYPKDRDPMREFLSIPSGCFVVGSFQKDGQGWGDGDEPKLIKGPDIFCDVLDLVKDQIPLHVVLSGPARGYVKKRLEKSRIAFTHRYLEDPDEIVDLYQALDCYLISSRVEGGPKALMESWACEVPLVSTRMGMVADYAIDGHNAFLAESEEVQKLATHLLTLYKNSELRRKIVEQGLRDVEALSYDKAVDIYKNYYLKLKSTIVKNKEVKV